VLSQPQFRLQWLRLVGERKKAYRQRFLVRGISLRSSSDSAIPQKASSFYSRAFAFRQRAGIKVPDEFKVSAQTNRGIVFERSSRCVGTYAVKRRSYSLWPIARSAAWPRILSSSCHEAGPSLPAA